MIQQPWMGEWIEGQAALYRAVTVLKGLEAGTEKLRFCSQGVLGLLEAYPWSLKMIIHISRC